MIIEALGKTGFICRYAEGDVTHSYARWDTQTITFVYSDGGTHHIVLPEEVSLSPFNLQYGITCSTERDCFFIQNWEIGLFCLSMKNGQILWHHKRKHSCDVIIIGGYVYSYSYGYGIEKLNLLYGIQMERFSYTGDGYFAILDCRFFLGPRRGQYLLIDPNFNIIKHFHIEELNPLRYEYFVIQETCICGNNIIVKGIECNSANDYIEAVINDEDNTKQFEFKRDLPF